MLLVIRAYNKHSIDMKSLNTMILSTICLFSFNQICAQKLIDGIYFASSLEIGCEKRLQLLNTETSYCLPGKPLIEKSNYKAVSEIQRDPITGIYQVVLKLDKTGTETLESITSLLKGRTIGLVVKGQLVSAIEITHTVSNGLLTFQQEEHSEEIVWLQKKLEYAIAKNTSH